jgi:hypothetical protein
MALARRQAQAGQAAAAARGFAWVWRHIPRLSPALWGVRGSYLVRDFTRVVRSDPAAWFDRGKDDPRCAALLDRLSGLLSRLLAPRDRWAELGWIYRDPRRDLAGTFASALYLLRKRDPEMEGLGRRMVRNRAAELVRALRACGRQALAADVEDDAARYDARLTELAR